MKKILFAVSAVALALWLDWRWPPIFRSYKAPPPVYIPPPPMWTGFYAGLNAGYGWGTSSNATTVGVPVFDTLNSTYGSAGGGTFGSTALANTGNANVNQSGFIGGGQIGYNWQYGSNFVFGLEADIQGAGIRGSGSLSASRLIVMPIITLTA